MFEIESRVPMKSRAVYPFRQMKAGDSFFVPISAGDGRQLELARVYNACTRWRLRLNIGITARQQDGGIRVWRTGDAPGIGPIQERSCRA